MAVHRSGRGPDLVLFHGGMGSWRHWVRNVDALGARFTVHALDHPSYGDSASVPRETTGPQYLDLVHALLLEALPGRAPLRFAGFSFGAAIAANMARRLGPRVSHLALISPGGFPMRKFGERPIRSYKEAGGDERFVLDEVLPVLRDVVLWHDRGTRFGIKTSDDGLLRAGEPGVQLTWMDAKIGDWVVTPRIGKPVEIQALWLNALGIAARFSPRWQPVFERGLASFRDRFWNPTGGCLFDVVDCDHRAGTVDATFRPNQILAVGGLPFSLLEAEQAAAVVAKVEARLWVPLGLRSLAPGEAGYAARYDGGVRERDSVYHQGTVWPWLIGPFVEAWVRVHGETNAAKREARGKFLAPLLAHLDEAGLGHISEIADAEPPHTPRGCPFQAWSVGEALRLDRVVLAENAPSRETKLLPKRACEVVLA